MFSLPARLVVVAVVCVCTSANAAKSTKSHLLFIIADDCTFRDLGCYSGQAHTPNIDRLAHKDLREDLSNMGEDREGSWCCSKRAYPLG